MQTVVNETVLEEDSDMSDSLKTDAMTNAPNENQGCNTFGPGGGLDRTATLQPET